MEKLPMCRICLVQNVRMYVVVNRHLHELYEKLTDIPFVTEDSRPMLACFLCCAKLKQCYRIMTQCLQAEELFSQMMKEDHEPKPLINKNHLEFCSGFTKSPIKHVCIDDESQTDSIAIKEELPAVGEGLDDIIEPKEEPHSDELELGSLDNSCLDVADIPPHYSESGFEYVVPLMEFKTEVEEEEVPNKKRRASETRKLELESLDNSCLDVADIPPHYSESGFEYVVPLMQFKTEVEEEEVPNKKRRASETRRATVAKKPKLDSRRTKLEDAITAEQTNKEKSDSKVIRTTPKCTSNPATCLNKMICTGTQIAEKSNCDVCQRSFSTNSDLKKHIRIHTAEKPHKCDVCQRSFSRKTNLTQHIRIHTGEKPYKCDVCLRSFRHMGDLTKHIRIHTGEKPHNCDVCQRSFRHKGDLTKHIRIHTGEKPYNCDVCQRCFRHKRDLRDHSRIHTGEKPFKCEVCQRCFSQRAHLKQHIRIHTSEKPYTCDVCQGIFTNKSSLTKHIRIHSGEKPYKCDVCQHSFSQKAHLTQHIRLHTGEKPYKCDVCQHCFNKKSTLTDHIRKHTGEKPYKCVVCQRGFSKKSGLTAHYRIHTVEKPL